MTSIRTDDVILT